MYYEINIEIPGFEGTLDLLVQWVRRYEIDIVDVRLSDVARQVAGELLEDVDLLRFSPFLTLSKLMFIKSRTLLPGEEVLDEGDLEDEDVPEDEEEPTRVRERLEEVYKTVKAAGEYFKAIAAENNKRLRSFQTRRGELPEFIDEIAYIEQITPFDLMITMNKILKRNMDQPVYRVKVDEAQLLSDRISRVFDFVFQRRGTTVSFDDVIEEQKQEKPEVVLSFLAVVFLVTQGKVVARQQTPYGDIYLTIRRSERRASLNAEPE